MLKTRGWRLLLLGGLLISGVAGCAGPKGDGRSSWWPFSETPDEAPGVVAPYRRMAEYRMLAKEGRSFDPAKKQEVSRRLAGEMRSEPDPIIRAQIARTLGSFKTPEATETLRRALEDSSVDVRLAACESWGNWAAEGDAEAVRSLNERVASDTENDVRRAATEQLGRSKDPAALRGLSIALDDPSPALQHRAVLSLRKTTREDLGNDVNQWRQFCKSKLPASDTPTAVAGRPQQTL